MLLAKIWFSLGLSGDRAYGSGKSGFVCPVSKTQSDGRSEG